MVIRKRIVKSPKRPPTIKKSAIRKAVRNAIRKPVKKEALEHYDRMIAWAKKRFWLSRVNRLKMRQKIKETWQGNYCSYCNSSRIEIVGGFFIPHCPNCKLQGDIRSGNCCDGLWAKMNKSKTWGTWVKRAKKVREYIKENG